MFRKFGLTALKVAAVALVVTPMLLLGPACNPECLDKFDCLVKSKRQADGTIEKLTCENNKCVPGDPTATACPDGGGC